MIFDKIIYQLNLLGSLINKLSDQPYSQGISHLGNSSIGGHTRHIIELLQCTLNGYECGIIDYFNRDRNLMLESDRLLAQKYIQDIIGTLQRPDKQLSIIVDDESEPQISSTYFRELVYNTEHTIHHLALMKVALIEINLNIVSDDFGMAYSTIKYKSSLASIHS